MTQKPLSLHQKPPQCPRTLLIANSQLCSVALLLQKESQEKLQVTETHCLCPSSAGKKSGHSCRSPKLQLNFTLFRVCLFPCTGRSTQKSGTRLGYGPQCPLRAVLSPARPTQESSVYPSNDEDFLRVTKQAGTGYCCCCC